MKFGVNEFSFLQDNEFPAGYTKVTRTELEGKISDFLAQGITPEDAPDVFKSVETYLYFLDQIKSGCMGPDGPSDEVLTVKCDASGLIEQVYGPAIFKGEQGKPVMRVCDDFYEIFFNGAEMTCGIATGDAGVTEEGDDEKRLVLTFDGHFDVVDESFEVPFILETATGLNKAKVKGFFKSDISKVSDLLKAPPSGGAWTSLNDLEVGEYKVYDIQEQEEHPEYGRSWLIFLEGIGPAMSKGKGLKSKLERNGKIYGKTLAAGKPLTFCVGSKEELTSGTRVNCGFFSREPRPDRLVRGVQPKAMAPVSEQKELPSAPMQTIETTAEQVKVTF